MSGIDPGGGGGPGNTPGGAGIVARGSESGDSGTLSGDYYAGGQVKRVLLTFSDPVPEWPSRTSQGSAFTGTGAAEYYLFVNPSQLQITYPTRAQAMQTLGGAFIDSFGYGLPTGQIQGTFGWGKDLGGFTGVERMFALRKLYEAWQSETIRKGYRVSELIVASDRIHFEVFWGNLDIQRSANQPFLANYALPFTVVRDWFGPRDRVYSLAPVGTAWGGTPEVNEQPGGGGKR